MDPTTEDKNMKIWKNVFWAENLLICFLYDPSALPQGTAKNLFQPLDDYIDFNDGAMVRRQKNLQTSCYKW